MRAEKTIFSRSVMSGGQLDEFVRVCFFSDSICRSDTPDADIITHCPQSREVLAVSTRTEVSSGLETLTKLIMKLGSEQRSQLVALVGQANDEGAQR
jgi:hypothetical protein